jgi:hypothetical protein
VATQRNRYGRLPYPVATLAGKLKEFGDRVDVRDSQDRRVAVGRTHRFRHTTATSLINAGVPLHVVQRYLGHLSPTMTMHYAQTLQKTHEREFLRDKTATSSNSTHATCMTCLSSTSVPTGCCPTSCACCPHVKRVSAATPA